MKDVTWQNPEETLLLDHLLLPCFSLFLLFSSNGLQSWRAIPNLQNTGLFQLWSFPSKTHARMHSDTLTGGRSQCCGWPPWPVVWFTECEAPQQRAANSAGLTFRSSPPHIWPTKQHENRAIGHGTTHFSLAWALIEVGATWCTLRVHLHDNN